MNVYVSNNNKAPIYEQIKEQIKSNILKGDIKENDLLPSIRQLAKDLRISVITTTRAYNDLEEEGYIVTIPGKGCYVAPQNQALLKEHTLYEIETFLQKAIQIAVQRNITKKEFTDMLKILFEEAEYDECN